MAFKAYVWDLETTNLTTFMGRTIVASFYDLERKKMHTSTIFDHGQDPDSAKHALGAEKKLLLWILERFDEADILIGHNTKAFDCSFLRGRLAATRAGRMLPKRHHIDTYQLARHGFKGKPQGYSLENLLDFFQCDVQKDKPSKHDWSNSIILDKTAIRRIVKRCEADVKGNAELWYALRPYYHEWKGS